MSGTAMCTKPKSVAHAFVHPQELWTFKNINRHIQTHNHSSTHAHARTQNRHRGTHIRCTDTHSAQKRFSHRERDKLTHNFFTFYNRHLKKCNQYVHIHFFSSIFLYWTLPGRYTICLKENQFRMKGKFITVQLANVENYTHPVAIICIQMNSQNKTKHYIQDSWEHIICPYLMRLMIQDTTKTVQRKLETTMWQ